MAAVKQPNLYINRESSWLKFNERVLEEAEDSRLPLFERMRFLSIFGSNLDEFFMVRVGGLFDAIALTPDIVDKKTGMKPAEQLKMIYPEVRHLMHRAENCYLELIQLLAEEKIYQVDVNAVTPYQKNVLENYFKNSIKPYLSPQIIDAHHPFPYLGNMEQYTCVEFANRTDTIELAVVPIVNKNFSRYFIFKDESGEGYCFITTANLIYFCAESLFKKRTVKNKFILRVTRNGDLRVDEALYDEELDWREQMENILKKKKRSAVVRMQISKFISEDVQTFLRKKLKAKGKSIIVTERLPLSLNFIYSFLGELESHYPQLNYKAMPQIMPPYVNPGDSVMKYLDEKGSLFLAYPYHSMKPFLDLLDEAAVDPTVTSIYITLYRMASGSKVAQALAKAAENGKNVFVLVELKARFDEENNIAWSKRLEDAGCHISYGFDSYKVHSKLCVISRNINGCTKNIVQIGTGNYNEKTARQYTDFSYITTNEAIADEANDFFESISLGQFVENSKYMLVAPLTMKPRFLELIDREIEEANNGQPARIIAKVNGLSDKQIIDKLAEASKAGVKIMLYVRGICSLRSGVKGETDNITVKSMVGRFLEHPRIFVFGYGEREHMYIGSADWMTRNLNYRVEVAVEIIEENIRRLIYSILDILERDNMLARVQQPNGDYKRLYPEDGEEAIDSQEAQYQMFMEMREASLKDQAVDKHQDSGIHVAKQYRRHSVIEEDILPEDISNQDKIFDSSTKPSQFDVESDENLGANNVESESAQRIAMEDVATESQAEEAEIISNLPAKREVTMIEMPKGFWARLKFVLFGKI